MAQESPIPLHPKGSSPTAEAEKPVSSIDLERREDRFIIFVRDTPELMEAMARFTRELAFPDTPVTRTVYFGDAARGLPRGLSIKARTYERERLPGRWDLGPQSLFQLLELKRTVEVDRPPFDEVDGEVEAQAAEERRQSESPVPQPPAPKGRGGPAPPRSDGGDPAP